ncbi:hypothetical protein BGZ83_009991, partial [Gryganskiella cystojenkinii]
TVPPDCKCKKAYDTCGSTFDDACNLVKTKLYTCAAAGDVPTPGKDCAAGCTDNGPNAADTCKPDCKCKDAYDTCGSVFDPVCNKDNKTLYTCTGAGTDPVLKKACDGICVHIDGKNDECRCVCTDDGSVCGSAFVATCNLAPNTLYKCTNGKEPVIDKPCDPGTCSANVIKGASVSSDTNDFQALALTDFCIDQCNCKEAGVPICADAFPAVCNYKNGTLMNCAAVNAVPTVNKTCTNGCIVQPGPDVCRPDPCACQKAGDTCSSSFPANCSYDANTLYSCTGKDAIPQKKIKCESNEVCTPVAGGDDFCGKNDNCNCVGSGTVCGSDFPPNCNKTASSVYTCPAGTETPCPNGCANGVCIPDCLCKVDGNVCGSSFPPNCNLQPNAVYKCTNGQAPKLDSDCEMLLFDDAFMQACGSTFPANCSLTPTALYTCTAAGAKPSDPKNCTAGCLLTRPDNSCASPCVQPAKDAASALNTVVQTLTTVLQKATADNTATVELPVFIKLFTDLSTNLTTAAAGPEDALVAISYSVNMTANAGFMILRSGLYWNVFQNATRDGLVPVNTTQKAQVLTLLNALIACTGSTTKDCSALNALYKEFVRVATPVIAAYTTPVKDNRVGAASGATATFSVQFASAIADLDSAIATKNQTKLNAAGLLLNQIIGLAMDPKYGSSAAAMGFAYDAAGYAAECAGLNVTDWRDPCKIFGQRTMGYLVDLVSFLGNILESVPIVGPLVAKPILDQLKLLLVDAQTGIATAIGGILSIVQAILAILDIAGPGDTTNQIRDYILKMVGITNPPPECQTGGCQGIIMAFKALLDGVYNIINQIPVIGSFVTGILKGLTDPLIDAINQGSAALIGGAAKILLDGIGGITTAVNNTFGLIPFIGDYIKRLTAPFDILVKGVQAILTCWIPHT